nr:mismatch-specific DNA-glycosylase [Limobrevibacterium gyesilva]
MPDLLGPGLRVVFCGTVAGTVSAARGAYYAGPGNRFWPILAATGLTPRLFRPAEFRCLLAIGIGLTDLAKSVSGADTALPARAFDAAGLSARIRAARPAMLAFNGKKAAATFLNIPGPRLAYGPGPVLPDFPPVFVLPSTSGAARANWDPAPWFALAAALSPPAPAGSASAAGR